MLKKKAYHLCLQEIHTMINEGHYFTVKAQEKYILTNKRTRKQIVIDMLLYESLFLGNKAQTNIQTHIVN